MIVPLTPIRFLYRGVDLYGKKVGVVSGAKRFTYAEFGERCERLATALAKHGIQPGDRVAYLSFNNHQLIEGYYGVVDGARHGDAAERPADAGGTDRHSQPCRLRGC